jgi:hypothetical protein
MSIKAGTTSRIIFVKFRDKSVTTEYAGLSGLTSSSPGLACNYVRDSATSVTSVVLAPTTLGVYVPNGLCEVGATAFKGVYMFCLPDGALAVGAKSVVINFYGATNLEDYPIEIELTATDNQDGTRGGITALPAVVSGSAGGVIVQGTGTTGLNVSGGVVRAYDDTGAALATAASQTTINSNVAAVPAAVWAVGARSLTDKAGFSLAASGVDAITVDGQNVRQALALVLAGITGQIAGAGPGSNPIIVYASGSGTGTARITITADIYGNRTNVVLNPPA